MQKEQIGELEDIVTETRQGKGAEKKYLKPKLLANCGTTSAGK